MDLMENELIPYWGFFATDTRTNSGSQRCDFIGTGVITLHFFGPAFNQFRVFCCIFCTT